MEKISKILWWVLAILSGLFALSIFTLSFFVGVILLLLAIFISPAFGNFLNKKYHKKISTWLKIVLIIVVLIIVVINTETSTPSTSNHESEIAESEETVVLETEPIEQEIVKKESSCIPVELKGKIDAWNKNIPKEVLKDKTDAMLLLYIPIPHNQFYLLVLLLE
jgi:energy-coupling factor transporter transmembrane protein EcfT